MICVSVERGQVGLGILKLITFGGLGMWALIDGILYMVGGLPSDSAGKWITDKKTLDLIWMRTSSIWGIPSF
ncbi:MAG: TM2 domain-containing protein [Deltaproteobacteria bacterium]|nr:TM2 domain-containing protein [Deltaproteobacteria bacterium]